MLKPIHSIRHPLRLRIGFSYCLLGLLSFMHMGAVVCVVLAALPSCLQVILSALVVWSLNRSLRKHIFWQARAVPQELVMQRHEIYLDDENVAAIENSYVQFFCALLRLRLADGRRETLLICADSITPDAFRRLRIRLKHPETRL